MVPEWVNDWEADEKRAFRLRASPLETEIGDIVLFEGQGVVFRTLSALLSIFDSYWRKLRWKPWHLAVVCEGGLNGYWVLESTGKGVVFSFMDYKALKECRIYRWLDDEPEPRKVNEFINNYIGCNYDVACYLFTMLQYLILHFFNHPIPRLLDNRFTCWELAFQFCREMGKPIQSLHKYPMITDFLREVKNAC